MKTEALRGRAEPLVRRDILAICAYLNRSAPKSVDGLGAGPEMHLDRLAAAARMQ